MSHIHADVALLTDHRYTASTAASDDWYLGNILRDDELLQKALNKLGLTSVRIDWAGDGVDWSAFRCAVFRTTWDYYDRISEFSAWLKTVEQQTLLCNDASIIWWNLDKHYLSDIASKGIPVVPSRFIEIGETIQLSRLLDETGWEEAIIKPCISGSARHTYRVNSENAAAIQNIVQPLLSREAFMLQPFLSDIRTSGEYTLMIIDGQFTHAVRKTPKDGDFRVQDDHGGAVHPCDPTEEQIELAKQTIAVCEPPPVYGRVDMVRGNNGEWVVMELELIEPELWLREQPVAAEIFAGAISKII